MFFQFSPPKHVQPVKKETAPETAAVLSLAPFTPNPKLFFENVKVGQTAMQKLIIKNPTPHRIFVNAHIKMDEKTQLCLSWSEKYIEAGQEDVLQIFWTPTVSGSWRYMMRFHCGGPPREVPIVLKCTSPTKKPSKPTKTLPRYVTKKQTSPVYSLKKKSPKRFPLPNMPDVVISSPGRTFNGKENVPEFLPNRCIPCRRDTYTLAEAPEAIFEDSLEKSQTSMLSFEDRLKSESFVLCSVLTPRNEFNPEHCSTDEKSVNSTSSFTGRRFQLFPDEPKKLSPNASNETYVKNLSSETFTKHNLSSETYTKDLSGHTYSLDVSDRDVKDLSTPPSVSKKMRLDSLLGASVKNTLQADLWCNNNRPSRPLRAITEELEVSDVKILTTTKRKSEVTSTISPKRQNFGVPHITDWKKQYVSIIDPEMALRLEQHEDNFKKWLNAVLSPPSELEAVAEQVDVAKLWRDCLKKEVATIPVVVSSSRLNALRKSFKTLYKSQELQGCLMKVRAAVDSSRLSIRKDRDVHLDLALQTDIMRVVLSYNPLWLRLGLETVYDMEIPLRSNSDIMGLTNFLKQWFIKNPLLLKKHKSVHSPRYSEAIKKVILKKFLALVYLLDRAKTQKLIRHDPCLFCKNAPIKDSREALIRFARDTITSIGDITKFLKHFSYVVEHKQTYLDEFDYSVDCLGVDLRDGVRLTRVMEMILLQPDLSKNLRVPAISRLQKVHNMKIVFDVLKASGFEVMHEIAPSDITNGHKEKTLCFLWQIIHKMETPLMRKSVTVITRWWRSEAILRKREELKIIRVKRTVAATKIQRWYRLKKHQETQVLLARKTAAAVRIQSCVRMFLAKRWYQKLKYSVSFVETLYIANKRTIKERDQYQQLKHAALVIQRRYRANELRRLEQMKFATLKEAAIVVQRKWRAQLAMRKEFQKYQLLKASTILIQIRFRATLQMRKQLNSYLEQRAAVIVIQRKWRATVAMRDMVLRFQVLKAASIVIQRRFRAKLVARTTREQYQHLKAATVAVQRRWRAILVMRLELHYYQKIKNAVVVIQRRYRETIRARVQCYSYHELKRVTIFVQRQWRAKVAMRIQRRKFQTLKTAVIACQRQYRAKCKRHSFLQLRIATVHIQRRWRAQISMTTEMKKYTALKNATLVIQRRFRATVARKTTLEQFQTLKKTTIFVQRQFRAKLAMRVEIKKFQELKMATLVIQRRFRANLAAKLDSQKFATMKRVAILVQTVWRGKVAMRVEMKKFHELRRAAICVQRRWRARNLMKVERAKFEAVRKAALIIQQRFRATVMMRKQHHEFVELKRTAVLVQRAWRVVLSMKSFATLKRATITVQRRWRANVAAKECRKKFEELKAAVITVQRRWRGTLAMRTDKQRFRTLRIATLVIQRRFRANLAAKLDSQKFATMKRAAILVQRVWRGKVAMRIEMKKFHELKRATICVQRRWRAKNLMKVERAKFEAVRKASLIIQQRFRATMMMRKQHHEYVELKRTAVLVQRAWRVVLSMKSFATLKSATITVQRRWRANVAAKECRKKFEELKAAVITVQRSWRGTLAMRTDKQRFRTLRIATVVIQRRFRAKIAGKAQSDYFLHLRESTICIQRHWRGTLAMRSDMQRFAALKHAVLVIQARYKAKLLARAESRKFAALRKAVGFVQKQWRAKVAMRVDLAQYQALRNATVVIQRRFRATLLAKTESCKYERLKAAVILVQRRWRANVTMKAELRRYESLRAAVVVLQRRYRAVAAIRREEQLHEDSVAIIQVQRFVRGFLVRKKYSEFLCPEAVARRKVLRIQSKAATLIQRVWRGYKIRSSQTAALVKIYEKLKEANEKAVPDNTLGSRCKNAVMQLSKSNTTLADMLKYFHDLDFITRRCQQSLLKLRLALPKRLYETVISTNRSLYETEVSTVAAAILVNFYRFEQTRVCTWIPEYMEGVVTVMLHSCDKETALFPTLCTLLWFFLENEEYKAVILKTPKFNEKILQIKNKVDRKARMVSKMNVNHVSFFCTKKGGHLPSKKPDWGLNCPDRPRTFTSAVRAINCILSALTK